MVEDKSDRNDEVEDVKSLGTKAVRQDFDGVHDDERRECKAVKLRSITDDLTGE